MNRQVQAIKQLLFTDKMTINIELIRSNSEIFVICDLKIKMRKKKLVQFCHSLAIYTFALKFSSKNSVIVRGKINEKTHGWMGY